MASDGQQSSRCRIERELESAASLGRLELRAREAKPKSRLGPRIWEIHVPPFPVALEARVRVQALQELEAGRGSRVREQAALERVILGPAALEQAILGQATLGQAMVE